MQTLRQVLTRSDKKIVGARFWGKGGPPVTYRWFLRFGQKMSQKRVAQYFEALNLSF